MSQKAYWIAQVDVSDPEGYKKYLATNGVAFRKYGAKFITRGGRTETLAGKTRSRVIVIEFKDYETAKACYHSAEYAPALKLRDEYSVADIAIIEGYDGPQPTD